MMIYRWKKSNKIEDIACFIKEFENDVLGLDTEIKIYRAEKLQKIILFPDWKHY